MVVTDILSFSDYIPAGIPALPNITLLKCGGIWSFYASCFYFFMRKGWKVWIFFQLKINVMEWEDDQGVENHSWHAESEQGEIFFPSPQMLGADNWEDFQNQQYKLVTHPVCCDGWVKVWSSSPAYEDLRDAEKSNHGLSDCGKGLAWSGKES